MKKNLIKYWEVKDTVDKAFLIMSFIVLGVLFGAILFYGRLCVLHFYYNNLKYALITGAVSICSFLSSRIQVRNIKRILKPDSVTEEDKENRNNNGME